MAKSKDTTTLLAVTRRKVLASGILAPLMPVPALLQRNSPDQLDCDPVLALWQEWQRLHTESENWLVKWQELETFLFRTVGFPKIVVPNGDRKRAPTYVTEHEEIDELLGEARENRSLRKQLHADLSARQARWNAAAAVVQFDTAEARHETAQEQAEAVMGEIFGVSATSLLGLAAKLTLISRLGEEREGDDSEFPWPHIRSALTDLQRLADIPDLSSTL